MTGHRVFLGGEGPNELGGWANEPAHQRNDRGAVEALLRSVPAKEWNVVGALRWKDIKKLRARGPTPNEGRNVLGLAEAALRDGATVLAFVRDSDGKTDRSAQVRNAAASVESDGKLQVVGGTAEPVLEAWILAMLGVPNAESLSKSAAQRDLLARGVAGTDAMVHAIENCTAIADGAPALSEWCEKAAKVLTSPLDE